MAEEGAYAVYEGVRFPEGAWRIAYEYVTEAKAPDVEFNRRMAEYGVAPYEASRLYYGLRWEPREIVWEVPVVPPPPPIRYEVRLASRQDTDETRDLGTITLNGVEHDLPATVRLEAGDYEISYAPDEGYEFISPFWETTGAVTVTSAPIPEFPWLRTFISVYGDCGITAVYRAVGIRECRLWTFTRYYRYIARKRKDTRDFELTVVLPFLADWTESDIRRYESDIIALCDKIMREALWKAEPRYYDVDTWKDVYETDPLYGLIERDWARGWESDVDTIMLDVTETQRVEWVVVDKARHYFSTPPYLRRGTIEWTIPT